MIKIEDFAEDIKDNILIISLIVYGLGLIYEAIYYSFFNIPIIYYISLQDILLTSIKSILALVILTLLIWLIHNVIFHDIKRAAIRIKNYKVQKSLNVLLYICLTLGIIIILLNISNTITTVFITIFCVLVNLYFGENLLNDESDEDKNKFNNDVSPAQMHDRSKWILVSIYVIFTLLVPTISAVSIKNQKFSQNKISFKDNKGLKYNTELDSTSLYIGETTSNIFLYNKNSARTLIFYKEDLQDIEY